MKEDKIIVFVNEDEKIVFDNYVKIDILNILADVVAKIIKDKFPF